MIARAEIASQSMSTRHGPVDHYTPRRATLPLSSDFLIRTCPTRLQNRAVFDTSSHDMYFYFNNISCFCILNERR